MITPSSEPYARTKAVRGPEPGSPIELRRDANTGRTLLTIVTEAGTSFVDVDLWDLFNWLQTGFGQSVVLDNGAKVFSFGGDLCRDREGD